MGAGSEGDFCVSVRREDGGDERESGNSDVGEGGAGCEWAVLDVSGFSSRGLVLTIVLLAARKTGLFSFLAFSLSST